VVNTRVCFVATTVLGGMLLSTLAAEPPAQQSKLPFKSKFTLKWPGKPSEDSQILKTNDGEEKHYSAMFADKQPEGAVVYSAFVIEYPEKALKGTTPKEMLAAYVFAFQKEETSRKEIEHGKNKHPGLDITSKSAKFFGRKVVVMVQPRLYEIAVTAKNESSLKTKEVSAFFDSLKVEE